MKKLLRRVNYWATPLYERMPEWCFPERPRRFHAYGVGMAKTGTSSLGVMFEKNYRTAHEPEIRFLTYKILAFAEGKLGKDALTKYVKHQDRRLGLEMNSSNLNYHVLDILVNNFADAQFIV